MWAICCKFYKKSEEYVVGYVPMLNVYEVDKANIDSFSVNSLDIDFYSGFNSYDLMTSIQGLADYGIWYNNIEFLFITSTAAFADGYNPQNHKLLYNPQIILESTNKLLQIIQIAKDNPQYYADYLINIEKYDEEKQLIKLKENLSTAIQENLLVEFIFS